MYSKVKDKFLDELLFGFSFFDKSIVDFISILLCVDDKFCYFFWILNIDKGSKTDFTYYIKILK